MIIVLLLISGDCTLFRGLRYVLREQLLHLGTTCLPDIKKVHTKASMHRKVIIKMWISICWVEEGSGKAEKRMFSEALIVM